MSEGDHATLMGQAIEIARRGWGSTHPNPMVGALLTETGRVIATGYHRQDGGPHAERVLLDSLPHPPSAGATLYVTLEPCSTAGRTGACTDAIIASGLRQVVVGALDPNPLHAGKGLDVLRAAGIEVLSGVLEDDCNDLNLIYNHWITRNETMFAGKIAATLDGRIATRSGDSKWITGEVSRADVHRWRRLFPGIAVGAGTVMTDNPRLTSRMEGQPEACALRFVFDGRLRTVVDAKMPHVYSDSFARKTVVVTTQHSGMGYVRKLRDLGVTVWIFDSPTASVSLAQFRTRCAAENLSGVLFEGGAQLMSRALLERQLDYLLVYQAPMFLADERAKPVLVGLRTEKILQAIRMTSLRRANLGNDSLVRGAVVYPERMQVDETLFSLG